MKAMKKKEITAFDKFVDGVGELIAYYRSKYRAYRDAEKNKRQRARSLAILKFAMKSNPKH